MNETSKWLIRSGIWLLLLAILSGCAGYLLNRDGLSLIDKGNYEEGLKKLSEASNASPRDAGFRADYSRNLEQTLNRLLAAASSKKLAGQPEQAQALLERVLRIDPGNDRATLGLQELEMDKRHAAICLSAEELAKKGDMDGAEAALRSVLQENPKNAKAQQLHKQIEDRYLREQADSIALQSKFKKPVNLQFRDANLKLVFEALSRTSGINILMDKDVKADLKTSVVVKDVSVEDTIDIILLQNQLEKKILNENTVFVYPNTQAKLKEYKELKIRSFHLVNADAKQMLTMIKTLLKTKDLFVHEKTNSLVMRDTPEAIRLAEKIIADQDGSDPEVMLEVEVLEVSHSRLTELGINYPNSLTISPTNAAGSTTGLFLSDLDNINRNTLAVSSLSAGLNLKLQEGDVNMLASPRIRVRNREKAKILIGDRVPVINESTQVTATGTAANTNVNYLDVGLKLEVEPDIHSDREVGIKISLEVSNIAREINVGKTLAYQIGTRTTSTLLRLKDGETQVLAGLISDDDRKSSNSIPGLGELPVLGRLFSSRRDDGRKTEIILSITPHVVGNVRLPEASEIEFWTGTEASLNSKSISLKTIGEDSFITTNNMGLGRTPPRPQPQVQPQPKAPVQPQAQQQSQPQAQPVPLAVPVKAVSASASVDAGASLAMTWLGPAQAKVGSKLNLTLNGQSPSGIGTVSLLVNYDPSSLKFNDVLAGGFWKQTGSTPLVTKTVDPVSGQVLVDITQPVGQEEAKGSGSILTLNFDVTSAKAQSQVSVTHIKSIGTAGSSPVVTTPEPHNLLLK